MDIFDLKLEVIYYFFAQLVEHAFLLVGILDLAHKQIERLPDILVEQLLLADLAEVGGVLFELDDHVHILDRAGYRH